MEKMGQATALRWGGAIFSSTHPSLHSFLCPLLSPTWLHPPIPDTVVKALCSLDPTPLRNVPNAHPGSVWGSLFPRVSVWMQARGRVTDKKFSLTSLAG